MTMTEPTPMMMPSMVRRLRIRFLRMLRAAATVSFCHFMTGRSLLLGGGQGRRAAPSEIETGPA